MKILFTCTYSSGISGVWNRVQNIGKEMIKRGHEIHVFSSDFGAGSLKQVANEEIVGGIHCHRFPARKWISRNALDFSKSKKQMQEKLRRIKPDVVDCQTYRHSEGNIASEEAEKLGIKCFLTTHAPFVSLGVRGAMLSLMTWMYDLIFSGRLERFKKIIAISRWEYPYLNKLGVDNSRIAYVPNGIPVEFFKSSRKFGKRVKRVLFFGRIAPVKDIETLLMAWAFVEKERKDIMLEIIGPAELEYKQRLDKIILELGLKNVKFGRAVFKNNEKIRAYSNAEIFVLPSRREGMPQSLIEAMSTGNIVIASDIIANREIVQNGKNGFLFKMGDENELAHKLEDSIKSYTKLGSMARTAMKDASSFRWDKIADKLEKVYRN